MSYLADLVTVLACAGQIVLNFSPGLLAFAGVAALIKSVSPGCRRGSERTYPLMSNSGYHTTAAQLRASAHDPPFPFEDLERELEQTWSPSEDYLRQVESSQVSIADWLSVTRINTQGPCYQRISRLRVALRRRHDLVSRAVCGVTLAEMIADRELGQGHPDATLEQRALWEAV